MSTIGYLLILAAVLIARQTAKGRVLDLPEDLSDAFLALARGDTNGLTAVFARTGKETDTVSGADIAVANLTNGSINAVGTTVNGVAGALSDGVSGLKDAAGGLAMAAVLLGSKAKGYKWAATGPDYYDCSGLMYKAAQGIGYKGARFTTASVPLIPKTFKRISSPATSGPGVTRAGINDLVVWPPGSGGVTGHMGVIYGPDQFYSARSIKSGIGVSKISTFRSTTPRYYRYIGPRK
jgi:cell wall-associated NlpC family hydrolase